MLEEVEMAGFTIGKVAKASGVGVETIRFYQRSGLINEPTPIRTSFREYPAATVDRIRFIKRAQNLGFTLTEIQELLGLSEQPGASRREVKAIAEAKLESIQQKIADLKQMEATLSQLVHDCSGRGKVPGCPIIEAIVGGTNLCKHNGT